ncbi:hypothetical protein L873DRAFT_1702017 [Choiromyces venosus 120613-1]|uniref:F-box domain-containing protein n=1 Tax=Choiromyces venosus 120613-1 TaxID=1336337 RepID=A0A3N4J7W9_9PEZI|nr:hypothetical protein L873DRAFT_1702017 [Choiromyces venosus 120613-1]
MAIDMRPRKARFLLCLPDELLVEIISHLPPKDVIPLHATSRRLRALTRLESTLWRSLCSYRDVSSLTLSTPPRIPVSDVESATIDWYTEYKFRNAPTKMRWVGASSPTMGNEVKGIGAFSSRGGSDEDDMIVSATSDGSVKIWSLQDNYGAREVGKSERGLIFSQKQRVPALEAQQKKIREAGIVDGVSIDETAGRIWVAGEDGLVEVDLITLKRVSTHRFPFAIMALSQTSSPYPLTVGTTLTLHMLDSRVSPNSPSPAHAHLFQPGPLSILHSGSSIKVAGRFPSLLSYDRRSWPKLTSTTYSGARLCGLTTIGTSGLAACGEYNGRGTLEIYPGPEPLYPIVKNRQTAARSKILTIASYGSFIVTGNAEGCISFFERDARTVIREHWVVGGGKASSGIWNVGEDGGDVIRRVKPLRSGDGKILVWAGDRLGLLGVGRDQEVLEEAVRLEGEEEEYSMKMRELLRRQGEEVRILDGMGL